MAHDPPLPIPLALKPGDPPVFPDPRRADGDGLIAIGGDLSEARLAAAYDHGIFPCHGPDSPPIWWSPDPRAVLQPETLHVSRRLKRRLRQRPFQLTWNRAFLKVMRACGRDRADGRWIVPDMLRAYHRIHEQGWSHSLEVWQDARLVGGLYGVQRGRLFAAESMFHLVTDASKIALVSAVRALHSAGIELFDVQYLTPHLASLGAREWPRDAYLERLGELVGSPLDLSDPNRLLDPGA